MIEIAKELNSLLKTLEKEDYIIAIDYIKLLAKNRKRQRALETISAINEFQSVLNGEKGWEVKKKCLVKLEIKKIFPPFLYRYKRIETRLP